MPGINEKLTRHLSSDGIRKMPLLFARGILNKFPILNWIRKYNSKWLKGDVIAGLTMGFMIVPQSLAYSEMVHLPAQHGLYSSFVGPLVYSFLGTAKDCVIGPSSIVALCLASSLEDLGAKEQSDKILYTSVITCLTGMILLIMGLFRLGGIFQFVSITTICAFAAASSVDICIEQFSKILQMKTPSTHLPAIKQTYNFFTNIQTINKYGAIIGLVSLVLLLIFRQLPSINFRSSLLNKVFKFASFSKNIIIIMLMLSFTFFLSYFVDEVPYSTFKNVPSGFPALKSIDLLNNPKLSQCFCYALVISLLVTLEHMGSAKPLGIQNKYIVDDNQELFALGTINLAASFFGAFPVTGSFSKSAVNSQSGVYTPLGGLITGGIVILSVQCLTRVFTYMPKPTLAAVIFSALFFKITGYGTVKKFFLLDVCDCFNYVATYLVIVLTDIKTGLVVSILLSTFFTLFRLCKPRWELLGETKRNDSAHNCSYIEITDQTKNIIEPLLPGIIIFSWQESLIYPNADYFRKKLMNCVYALTTPGNNKKQKAWSDDQEKMAKLVRKQFGYLPPIHDQAEIKRRYISLVYSTEVSNQTKKIPEIAHNIPAELTDSVLPPLRGMVIDLKSVNTIDYAGIQKLKDLKKELMEYSGVLTENMHHYFKNTISFQLHFANVHSNVLKKISYYEDLVGALGPDKSKCSEKNICHYGASKQKESDINYTQTSENNQFAADEVKTASTIHHTSHSYVHDSINDAVAAIINNIYG